jgi:tRNA (cytidine/uridine-2'-O-)-methyltransferase
MGNRIPQYEPRLHVVLHQPEIPQNTGNVGRTCLAVEAKLWLVRPLGFRLDDHHLRRAGLDYWEHLEWDVVDDLPAVAAATNAARFWYFSKTATVRYTSVPYQKGDVLVFGSETQGLPKPLLQSNAQRSVCIPTSPNVRSLNLSNAVAVAVYEAVRQWAE